MYIYIYIYIILYTEIDGWIVVSCQKAVFCLKVVVANAGVV